MEKESHRPHPDCLGCRHHRFVGQHRHRDGHSETFDANYCYEPSIGGKSVVSGQPCGLLDSLAYTMKCRGEKKELG